MKSRRGLTSRDDKNSPTQDLLTEDGSEERERYVGIICVIIYDDLALEAWTQRGERERENSHPDFRIL